MSFRVVSEKFTDVSEKSRDSTTWLHGVASQKTVKVKFSRYRSEQALGDPEGQVFRIFYDFRHNEDGKAVTLIHRPSLPPAVYRYSVLEAELTPGHMVPSVATEKFSSDTTGDRSRDPATSSAVP
jgi:hypothetical protein